MGTWSAAIFGNDTAADARATYRELIEDGRDNKEATAEVIRRMGQSAEDPDDGPLFWTGLAAAQAQIGRLLPTVRDRALDSIDRGADLHLWDDPKEREGRRRALAKLHAQLVGPQRSEVRLTRPRRKPSPVQKGQVFLLRLADGRQARFRVIAIEETRYDDRPVVELLDDRGRLYRTRHELLGKVWWTPAQFVLLAPRWKDLPSGDDLTITSDRAKESDLITERGYMTWHTMQETCRYLLDDRERARVE